MYPHTIQLHSGSRIHNWLQARKSPKVDLNFQKTHNEERKIIFFL